LLSSFTLLQLGLGLAYRLGLLPVLLCLPALLEGQGCPDFVVHASTLLDGRGNVMKNAVVQICGDRISAIGAPPAGTRAREINLSGFTPMPGWTDTHVHMAGHFDRSGRVADASEPPQEAMLGVVANAWATLEAGFTTVQSVALRSTPLCAMRSTPARSPGRASYSAGTH
jgi:imidazolonepropionase-like amidohydrolase